MLASAACFKYSAGEDNGRNSKNWHDAAWMTMNLISISFRTDLRSSLSWQIDLGMHGGCEWIPVMRGS